MIKTARTTTGRARIRSNPPLRSEDAAPAARRRIDTNRGRIVMTAQAHNHETTNESIDLDTYADRILSLCEFDLSETQIFTRPVDNDLVAKVMSFSQAVYSV